MSGFDMDELMAVKNGYQGQNFQWVKTNDRTKLGTVVRVEDILPGARPIVDGKPVQRYVAKLSDGTAVDTELLTNNLMMLLEDQPKLSMAEVLSINEVIPINAEEIKAALPADLRETSTIANRVNQGVPGPDDSSFGPGRNQINQQPAPKSEDLFGLFVLEDTELNLKVSVKLPASSFLKLMHSNSQDKDKFISQLSAYINNSITPNSITESVKKMLGQDKKKKIDEQRSA